MADRDVLMRFGLTEDPRTGAALQKLASSVRATMQEVSSAIGTVGDTTIAQISRIEKAASSVRQRSSSVPVGASGGSSYSQFTGPTSSKTYTSSYGDQLGRLGGMSIPPSDATAIGNQAKEDARAYTTAFRSELSGLLDANDQQLSKLLGTKEQFERLGKERGESFAQAVKEATPQGPSVVPGVATPPPSVSPSGGSTDQSIKAIEKLANEYGSLESESEKIKQKLGAGFGEFTKGTNEAAEGLAKVVGGVAALGLKGKEITQVVDTLLTIKGATDLFIGFTKTVTGVVGIFRTLGEVDKARARQQEITTQKQKLANQAVKEYAAVLKQEGVSIEQASQGNKEFAAALQRVTDEAEQAAQATKKLEAAQDSQGRTRSSVAGASAQSRTGGRAGAVGASVAGAVGSEAIGQTLGFGLTGLLANIGLDVAIEKAMDGIGKKIASRFAGRAGAAAASSAASGAGRAAAGLAGSAAVSAGGSALAGGGAAGAAGGAAGGAAAGGVAAIATTAAAAAAALGAVTLVAVELRETFTGTATKVGSVTDTIATWEVKIVDWVGDMTGLFDVVKGTKEAAKADKALEQRKKQGALDDIANQGASEFQVLRRNAEEALFEREQGTRGRLNSVNAERGRGSLLGIGLQRDNLRAELERETKFGKLLEGDTSATGRQRLEESRAQAERIRQQIGNVNAQEQGITAAGGQDQETELAERKAAYADELKKTMEEIEQLEAGGVKYQTQYVDALAYAQQLSDKIVGTEEEQLALVRSQKEERARANQDAINSINQRIQLTQKEGDAARNALKSGAERFAQLSASDQAAAIRAAEQAKSGKVESLTDKQRGLLRSIGTESAVAAAEQADRLEAEKKGFFRSFGAEEQAKAGASEAQVQQLKVELAGREQVAVKIENDYRKMAAEVSEVIRAELDRALPLFKKEIESNLQRDQRNQSRQTQEAYEKQRAVNKAT